MSDDLKNLYKQFGNYPAVKKNVLKSGDVDAINQLNVMEGKTSDFLQRRKMLGGVKEASKKLPGPIGKGVALGVLGVEAASEGIKKLRSMEGKDADPEIPSEVENKSKGGSIMARGNKLARMKPTKMY